MNAARPNASVAAVSLTVTAVIVVVMAVWGYNSATAPINDETTVSAEPSPGASCGPDQTVVDFLYRESVQVSVYNAGKRKGRAVATLEMLERARFRAGETGNAPEGTMVDVAEVRVRRSDASAGRLVALPLGKGTRVVIDDSGNLGPGVNVYIGDKFRKLRTAPGRILLPEAERTCE